MPDAEAAPNFGLKDVLQARLSKRTKLGNLPDIQDANK